MRIKWNEVWVNIGKWENEHKDELEITSNFRCTYNGINVLVIMNKVHTRGGHGEGSYDSLIPIFIKEATLEEVEVDGYIDVDNDLYNSAIELAEQNRLKEERRKAVADNPLQIMFLTR